jgi:hypothetical protein
MSENQKPKFKTPEEVDAHFDRRVNDEQYWYEREMFHLRKAFAQRLQELAIRRAHAKMALDNTSKYEVVFEDNEYGIKEKTE